MKNEGVKMYLAMRGEGDGALDAKLAVIHDWFGADRAYHPFLPLEYRWQYDQAAQRDSEIAMARLLDPWVDKALCEEVMRDMEDWAYNG